MTEADADRDGGSIRPEGRRLLLDAMLGKLAVYLRRCGYDAAYAGERGIEADDRLLELAADENRVLLTCDAQLADRATESILLAGRAIDAQLAELRAAGVELEPADRPSRCGDCNGRLAPVPGSDPTPEYAPDPAETDCWRCRDCGQVFWRGSHWDRMAETLAE
jgi:uncharacterized protein with PIN domain